MRALGGMSEGTVVDFVECKEAQRLFEGMRSSGKGQLHEACELIDNALAQILILGPLISSAACGGQWQRCSTSYSPLRRNV